MELNAKSKPNVFTILAIIIGGSLEWYEIGLFMAWPLLIHQDSSGFDLAATESVNAMSLFLLVIISLANGGARALGAWYFGSMGDRKGRRFAFPLTVLVATLPSWSLAILSLFISYDYWIKYSLFIFSIIKFFQGLPAGGEVPGAICYLSEMTKENEKNILFSRKFLGSFALIGPQCGIVVSTALCVALRALFSQQALNEYVWKYVFIISGILGILGYLMRQRIHETNSFENLKHHHKLAPEPTKVLFAEYKHELITAFLLSIYEVIACTILTFLPFIFSVSPYNYPDTYIVFLTLCYSILYVIFMPIIGYLGARFPIFKWNKLSVLGTIFFSPFLYASVKYGYFNYAILLSGILILFVSIQTAILPTILAEIFPTKVRYSGIAFSFNICDGVAWSAMIGICFLFIQYQSAKFILILPISAIIYPIVVQFSKSNKKLYTILEYKNP